MAKFIDQSQLRSMHGRTLLQAQKHFGHGGTNNREAWAHAYKASEKHNNRYNNLAENKEGHAEHAAQAAKLRAAGDEKGAKIHEELASHYHRAQGIEVPKKAHAPRASKDPLVQAAKAAKAKPTHAETMEDLHAKRADIASKTASAKEKTEASKARTAGMHEELGKVHAAKSAADEHNEGLKKKIGGLEHEVKKAEGAASKQEAANRKALRSSGEDDKHVPDHKLIGGAKEGDLSAAAHAASKIAEAEGTRENHEAARKAHYRAAQESMKADPTGAAKHSRLSTQHALKVNDLIREARRGSRYKRPASAVPTQAGSVAAGTHVRTNMAGEASKLAQNKALMGGDPEPAKPKKPRAPRKPKDPLVQAAKGSKTAAPAAPAGGDDKSKILAHMAKDPNNRHMFKDVKAATGMDQGRFSAAMGGLQKSGHLVMMRSDAAQEAAAHKEHAIYPNNNKNLDPRVLARLDQKHPEVQKLLAGAVGTKAAPTAESSARETSDRRIRSLMGNGEDKRNTPAFRDAVHERQLLDSRDKGAKAQSAALSGRVAGAKERLTASRERVAGMGKPAAPPTAAATHAAETQAKQTALTAAHGEELGKLHGAYSALAQHHEISARTASDGATKASHTNLAAHYGNARDTLKHADAAGRFKDSATAERDHAGHADAHRFAAKGASHPSIAGLHSKLAAHHDELHAHHLANKHGIGVEDARKAIGEAGESMRRGGIRSRGEAHNYQTGKKGGWYYTSKRGVKVYVGKGHR